jgi:hypothetical protein
MIRGMYFAVVIESVTFKPAPFENRRDAAPNNSKAFAWVVSTCVPPTVCEIHILIIIIARLLSSQLACSRWALGR